MKKSTAVLILNYNGKKFLEECLNSVLDQSYKDYDVFLVDNNSSDDSVEFIGKNFPTIKIISLAKNLGYAGGYNFAVKQLINDYNYFVLLNNDTWVDQKWLEELVLAAKDERVGLVGSSIINAKTKLVEGVGGFMPHFKIGTNNGYLKGIKIEDLPKEKQVVFYASGCAMLVKQAVIKEIGLFDDNYFAYFEDIDLSWRARLAGYGVIATPRSKVFHYGGGTSGQNDYFHYWAEKNRLATYYKNLNGFNLINFFPLLVLARIAMAFILSCSWRQIYFKLKGTIGFFYLLPRLIVERKKVQQKRKLKDREIFFKQKI